MLRLIVWWCGGTVFSLKEMQSFQVKVETLGKQRHDFDVIKTDAK